MKKLILMLLLCWSGTVWGQADLDSLVGVVRGRAAARPSELLYVHTSKGVYETGEDLWFKAYSLDVSSLGWSNRSQTLYLRVVDTRDSVVWSEQYPIDSGRVEGHLYVGLNWPTGHYFIESYTRHSFYEDSLSLPGVRAIRVVERIAADTVVCRLKPAERAIRFSAYPEGGDLVAGVPAVVAFEAMDENGRPIECSGSLTENGTPIQPFQTTVRGMGRLAFTPAIDKDYRLECADGTTAPLTVLARGLTLRLTKRTDDYLEFVVDQSAGGVSQTVSLVAQVRGDLYCVARGVVRDRLSLRLPLSEFLYAGIAEVTLYDGQGRPVAERLVAVHPERRLYISVRPTQEFYGTRQKAKVEIRTTDAAGKPISAHLGVSVFDGAYDDPAVRSDMVSYCLLSAEIRSAVFDPAYYFDPKNPDSQQALDLLLLTRGWRRYVWRQTEQTMGVPFLDDGLEGVLSLGTHRKRDGVVDPSGQAIQLSGPLSGAALLWTDSLGRFSVAPATMRSLRGGYLYLRPLTPRQEATPSVVLNDGFEALSFVRSGAQRFVPVGDTAVKRLAAMGSPIRSDDGSTLIEGVVVSVKGRLVTRDKVMGRLDSLAQAQFGPYECQHGNLENYLPGFTHHHDPSLCICAERVTERRPPVIGKRYHLFKPEYYECPKMGGWCFKVLDRRVITYTGALYSEEELLRMNGMWRGKGYYGARAFYASDETDALSSTPDGRNTLLWAPAVVTDKQGRATVEFYCSDLNTGFVVVVEGSDGAGLVGAGRGGFRVLRGGA